MGRRSRDAVSTSTAGGRQPPASRQPSLGRDRGPGVRRHREGAVGSAA